MHPKQMRYLMRRPEAFMRHQMTGRLPRMVRPQSPLISLLESLRYHERLRFRGIRLHPELGYHCGHQFHNAEQLLRWLKPDEQMLENGEPWPAESFRDKRFVRRLDIDSLKRHSAQYPDL
jgi:hypothetical protein